MKTTLLSMRSVCTKWHKSIVKVIEATIYFPRYLKDHYGNYLKFDVNQKNTYIRPKIVVVYKVEMFPLPIVLQDDDIKQKIEP
jgi:hypothetical protein